MMQTIHSYWAYLVLAIVILAVLNAITGVTSKREFKDKDLRLSLFTLIVTHIQFLIGLGWYFMSPWYKSMKETGIDANNRLLAVEHPFIMILAIILITMGWSKHKKKDLDTAKFKTIAIFYGLALVFILIRIPWTNWFN
jgi:Na+/H+-dicarboxylate symporter